MHYCVWVLCTGPMPEFDADVECTLHPLLDPYDYETPGPPVEVQCGCSTIEGRLKVHWYSGAPSEPESSSISEGLGRPWRACAYCQGKGKYVSRWNPVGRWDWWKRGGRWTGDLDSCQPVSIANEEANWRSGDSDGFDQGGQETLRDVAPADVVRDRVLSAEMSLPYAIIHPVSGAWIWSCTGKPPGDESYDDRRSDWREIVSGALLQAQFVVVVDAHN